MRLVFVRHGEPDYRNDCLTENGRRQAKCTAERLQKEGITAIYSSPMGRAMETAGAAAELMGLPVTRLPFMHEIDWGTIPGAKEVPINGHPWTLACKLLTEHPEYVGSDSWPQHPYFRDNRLLAEYRKVAEGFDDFLRGFGLERQDGLYTCRKECDDTIALFAHGGSGAVMFAHVLNLPLPFVLTTLPYGVCSISILAFWPEQCDRVIPRFEIFNDMGHLENVRQEKLHFDK